MPGAEVLLTTHQPSPEAIERQNKEWEVQFAPERAAMGEAFLRNAERMAIFWKPSEDTYPRLEFPDAYPA